MAAIAWYSDFDGVYNVPSSEHASSSAAVYPVDSKFLTRHDMISWNPDVLASFEELIKTGHFDFIWHTTWNDASNIRLAAAAMGLVGFDTHTDAKLNEKAKNKREWTEWKAHSIVADQAINPRPFIWVDDNAPVFWEDFVRGHTRAPSLIIKTDSRHGLSRDNLLTILDWTSEQLRAQG